MIQYDKHYGDNNKACGEPFPEIINFLEKNKGSNLKALDLGCGQGRDSIPLAKMGYSVVGVDVSAVGIMQLDAMSKKMKLDIRTVIGDIVGFKTRERFDVILMDRVLHMLPAVEEREVVLSRSSDYLKKNGFLLIADTPQNINAFKNFVEYKLKILELIVDKKNYLFYKRVQKV